MSPLLTWLLVVWVLVDVLFVIWLLRLTRDRVARPQCPPRRAQSLTDVLVRGEATPDDVLAGRVRGDLG